MAGGSITCGSFWGQDKSGSALEGVFLSLPSDADALVKEILAQLETQQHILISEQQALQLRPLLEAYREQLILQIGHDDWEREALLEEKSGMDSITAKWGAGRGWRLYCATDLILACKACLVEHQPICIAFD